MQDQNYLFDEFPPVSKKEWLAQVTKDLRGRAPEELTWVLPGELEADPFAHPDDAADTFQPLAGRKANWEIGESFQAAHPDANRQLLLALNGGVNAPELIFDHHAAKAGLLPAVLSDVTPGFISLHLCCPAAEADALISQLTTLTAEPQAQLGSLRCPDATPQQTARLRLALHQHLPECCWTLDDTGIPAEDRHQAPRELAALLRIGRNLIENLLAANPQLAPELLHKTAFRIEVTTSYFVSIAKLRAFTLLWANLLKAYGLPPRAPRLDVHFARASYHADPHSNMIRATTMAMSAILGGANRLTVLPAHAHTGEPDDFSRRIARNVQHLLKMESYFDQVNDPAAGSYYLEQLTGKLGEKAWNLFAANH